MGISESKLTVRTTPPVKKQGECHVSEPQHDSLPLTGKLSQNVRRRLPPGVSSEVFRCQDLPNLSNVFRENLNRNNHPVLAPPERVLQAGCVSESVVRAIFAAHENVDPTPQRERVIVTVVRGGAIGIEAQFGPASFAPCHWGPLAASL